MNAILKNDPVGIDYKIDEIQKRLQKKLCKWDSDVTIYPRCYVLEKEYGKTIEHFLGQNEYSGNLVYSEKNKIFFTAENDRIRLDVSRFKTSISLYGILNLGELFDESNERMDEEALSEIVDVINSFRFENLKIITNFDDIFDNSYSRERSRNINDNIHPYFYFKIEFEVIYQLNQIC